MDQCCGGPDITAQTLAANGTDLDGVVLAHGPGEVRLSPGGRPGQDRQAREDAQELLLAPGATRALGAGDRAIPETPDPLRTCFERDRDRILHSTALRRLGFKTQVFIAAEDHLRNRLTHSLEVEAVAVAIARSVGANEDLVRAVALGHDLGHTLFGHKGETALSPYVPGGYDHAVYGADVVAPDLRLTTQVLDGIRNHSWRRPAPATPEGSIVSLADRIAYSCHDLQDAIRAGILTPADIPGAVVEVLGGNHRQQLGTLIRSVIEGTNSTGRVGIPPGQAQALQALKTFMYERVYLRPESVTQGERAVAVIRGLVDLHIERPSFVGLDGPAPAPGSTEAVARAVRWVAGMTDRFGQRAAVDLLGWDPQYLPRGA